MDMAEVPQEEIHTEVKEEGIQEETPTVEDNNMVPPEVMVHREVIPMVPQEATPVKACLKEAGVVHNNHR